ncbi:hypothetical protein [Dissulfuribacter thermophilus]|nr:hypothetical protein [Dissulfuribacter thermophilus]
MAKVHVFFLCFLIVNALVVSAWSNLLQFGLVRIDFLIPSLCWYAVTVSDLWGGIIVLFLGLFFDLMSGVAVGTYLFLIPGVYFFVRYIASNTRTELWWQRALLVILASFVFQATIRTFTGYIETVWPWGAIQAILDGLLSIILFPMFSSVLPLLESEKNE